MRAWLVLSAMVLLSVACDRPARVRILDARTSRTEDLRVIVDIELEAVEQGGGNVGQYCVSINWFVVGFDPNTQVRAHYERERDGLVDSTEVCDADLRDGDQRTHRLLSTNGTEVRGGLPGRVQVRYGDSIDTKEAVFSP